MAHPLQLGLQDAASPIMEELTRFRDHALMTVILVSAFVLYFILMTTFAKLTSVSSWDGPSFMWAVVTPLMIFTPGPVLPDHIDYYWVTFVSDSIIEFRPVGCYTTEFTLDNPQEISSSESLVLPEESVLLNEPTLLGPTETPPRGASPCLTRNQKYAVVTGLLIAGGLVLIALLIRAALA